MDGRRPASLVTSAMTTTVSTGTTVHAIRSRLRPPVTAPDLLGVAGKSPMADTVAATVSGGVATTDSMKRVPSARQGFDIALADVVRLQGARSARIVGNLALAGRIP